MMSQDDRFSQHRHPFLKTLLEDERRRLDDCNTARQTELRRYISQREAELQDDDRMYQLFEQYMERLPEEKGPITSRQEAMMYVQWEGERSSELAAWKDDLNGLESQLIDGQQVLDNAKERILILLEAEAKESGLLPHSESPQGPATREGANRADRISASIPLRSRGGRRGRASSLGAMPDRESPFHSKKIREIGSGVKLVVDGKIYTGREFVIEFAPEDVQQHTQYQSIADGGKGVRYSPQFVARTVQALLDSGNAVEIYS